MKNTGKIKKAPFVLTKEDLEKYRQITIFNALEGIDRGGMKNQAMFSQIEKEIIKHILNGLKTYQIALEMNYSESSIKKKKQAIYRKLKCNDKNSFVIAYYSFLGFDREWAISKLDKDEVNHE